jgi:nitrate/nitrite transport system substrate-binding protein
MTDIPHWLKPAIHAGGSEGLEQTRLTLGFMPLTDCAPLAVALEKGYFARHGLDVALSRQMSWASIRDKLVAGALDGAHMLAAMPLATTLGLGEVRKPLLTALSLDLNGNAVTVSRDLHRRLVAAGPVAAADRPKLNAALAALVSTDRAAGRRPLRFAMVFPFSTHNYLLRYWLAAGGIHPDRDIHLSVVPPPYMVEALRSGDIDGYCVGEPWNEQAVAAGVGRSLLTDYDIWNNHPEKVLGVSREWAERHPNTHKALLMALLEAAEWIDRPENRLEVVEIISAEEYVNAPADVVKMSMTGFFRYGEDEEPVPSPDFNVFFRYAATFPWQSHAVWFLTQMVRWGQIAEPLDLRKLAEEVYRPDLYREAARELGLPAPAAAFKTEGLRDGGLPPGPDGAGLALGADTFCDGRVFDPGRPVEYLAGFELHSRKIGLDDLARLNP